MLAQELVTPGSAVRCVTDCTMEPNETEKKKTALKLKLGK